MCTDDNKSRYTQLIIYYHLGKCLIAKLHEHFNGENLPCNIIYQDCAKSITNETWINENFLPHLCISDYC